MTVQVLKYSQLSARWKTLTRLCQRVNYGLIRNVRVQNSAPALDQAIILVDERLDLTEEPRGEAELADFTLPTELCRLMARLDEIKDGMIERLEIRAGVPRRVVFEVRFPDDDAELW